MESFKNQDADIFQSKQLSFSLPQLESTEAENQTMNKNIEELKKLRNSENMFVEIYNTLNRIIMENDFDALNFAAKEKFYDYKNRFGETVFACSISECDFKLARFIMEFGGISNYDYGFSDHFEYSNMIYKMPHFAVNETLIYVSEIGNYDAFKFLLTDPGIDVNMKNNDNMTALIKASKEGHLKVVKLLLLVPGIDINAKDIYSNSALILASFYGHHEVVKLLLSFPGIDVSVRDINNNSALIWASRMGHHEVVKLFLIHVNEHDIKEAFIFATMNNSHEIVRMLKAHASMNGYSFISYLYS